MVSQTPVKSGRTKLALEIEPSCRAGGQLAPVLGGLLCAQVAHAQAAKIRGVARFSREGAQQLFDDTSRILGLRLRARGRPVEEWNSESPTAPVRLHR